MTDKVFVDGAEQINDSAEILNWYRNLYHTENSNTERGLMARAINDILPEHFRQKAEIERLKKIVEDYAKAARIIELYLHEFCNKKLPFDEMIADASRKAEEEIERLRHILVSFMDEVSLWGNKHNIDTSNIPKIAVLGTEKENIIKQIKSEAIKEFAERLKCKFTHSGKSTKHGDFTWDDVTSYELDNLVKEMTDFKE